MAGGKRNDVWLIVLLVVVAAGFGVLAFTKDKKQPVAASSPQDVLEDKNFPVPAALATADQPVVPAMKPALVSPLQVFPNKESFAIQVYSFKDKVRAEAALAKLKEKGYKSYVMESDLGARGVWYRVRVGSFSTDTEARTVLESILNEFKSGIIVTE